MVHLITVCGILSSALSVLLYSLKIQKICIVQLFCLFLTLFMFLISLPPETLHCSSSESHKYSSWESESQQIYGH